MKLNKFDLNKLHSFLEVAEAGGISKASEKLLLTRSALSQSLSSLESSLNLKLFDRVGKRMILTPAGRELHQRFREHQRNLESILSTLTESDPEVRGIVRIGLFIGFSKTRLTDFLAAYLMQNPKVQVKLVFVAQPELASFLTEGKIDFALSIYPLASEARGVTSTRLFEEELVLVSGKKHFVARPSPQEMRELPVIDYYENGQLTRTWVRHHFGRDVGKLNIRAYGAAIDFVLELILKHAGVGIVPKYVAQPYLAKGRLFQMSTGKPELADKIWLNEVKGLTHTPAARNFLEEMKSGFQS